MQFWDARHKSFVQPASSLCAHDLHLCVVFLVFRLWSLWCQWLWPQKANTIESKGLSPTIHVRCKQVYQMSAMIIALSLSLIFLAAGLNILPSKSRRTFFIALTSINHWGSSHTHGPMDTDHWHCYSDLLAKQQPSCRDAEVWRRGVVKRAILLEVPPRAFIH